MMEPGSLLPSALLILKDLIHERTGHFYSNEQLERLQDKLLPVVREHGLDSFLDLYYLLKYGEDAQAAWQQVERALAINETYFWREADQIKAVANFLVPKMQKERPGEVIRIWHAACASGEEPYSVAIALTEAGCYWRGPIEIIGTDFNRQALDVARRAQYRTRALRLLPEAWKENYFVPQENESQRLISSISKRVRFEYLNLMDQAAIEGIGEVDIIFCRNAFIYFSTAAIRQVTESFYKRLRRPGYLFLAAAESLLRITTLFELVEIEGALAYTKGLT